MHLFLILMKHRLNAVHEFADGLDHFGRAFDDVVAVLQHHFADRHRGGAGQHSRAQTLDEIHRIVLHKNPSLSVFSMNRRRGIYHF